MSGYSSIGSAAAFDSGVTLAIDGGVPLGTAPYPSSDHEAMPALDGFHRSTPPAMLVIGPEDR